MSNELDRMMKKQLEEHTNIRPNDKEEIWGNLERELFRSEQRATKNRRKKSKKKKISFVSLAAAMALLLVGTLTETGHAVIDQIKTIFAPEKEIVQIVEGNEEEVKVDLHQKSRYVIYVDEEFYQFVEGEESDFVVLKEPLDEQFPEVEMEIVEVLDKEPETIIQEWEQKLKAEFERVTAREKVEEPVNGWWVHAIDGSEWDSPVTDIYVISNERGGSFVFIQKYFLEAAEGHGARFYQMLQEFYLLDDENQ